MTSDSVWDETIPVLDEIIEQEITKLQPEYNVVQNGWRMESGGLRKSCMLTKKRASEILNIPTTHEDLAAGRPQVAKVVIYKDGKLKVEAYEKDFNPVVKSIASEYKKITGRTAQGVIEA